MQRWRRFRTAAATRARQTASCFLYPAAPRRRCFRCRQPVAAARYRTGAARSAQRSAGRCAGCLRYRLRRSEPPAGPAAAAVLATLRRCRTWWLPRSRICRQPALQRPPPAAARSDGPWAAAPAAGAASASAAHPAVEGHIHECLSGCSRNSNEASLGVKEGMLTPQQGKIFASRGEKHEEQLYERKSGSPCRTSSCASA